MTRFRRNCAYSSRYARTRDCAESEGQKELVNLRTVSFMLCLFLVVYAARLECD